ELRRRQSEIPVALYTGFASVNPGLAQRAAQVGCLTVMDKPLELRRIERLVEEVLIRKIGSRSVNRDQPFFGTSRMGRPNSDRLLRDAEPNGQATGTGAL